MWSQPEIDSELRWKIWVTVGLAAVSTFAAQSCESPLQNVMLGAAVIGLLGAVGGMFNELASAKLMLPSKILGGGRTRFGLAFWATPTLWVILILNSRGVARRLLRRLRGAPGYGFWVLSLTAFLVMGLEASAFAVNQSSTDEAVSRQWGKPWSHLAVWTSLVLASLALATPALINKSPLEREPRTEPMVIWLAMDIVVLTDAARRGIWWAIGALGLATALILINTVRIQRSFDHKVL